MAVTANTNETYDVTTIREDLSKAMASISPTETIFMSTIGSRNVDNTYFEWSEVDLAATGANRQRIGLEARGFQQDIQLEYLAGYGAGYPVYIYIYIYMYG